MNAPAAEITIRRMRPEDVPTVHAIDVMSFSLPWPERSFRYEVSENPASRCWVIEVILDGEPQLAGMLVLWLLVDEVHIATLAVHPDFRRQGIAGRLLVEALRAAQAEGARRAFLEVREGNAAAQAMYRKFGFEVTGRRPRYYKDTGEDAILMALEGLNIGMLARLNVQTCQRANVPTEVP